MIEFYAMFMNYCWLWTEYILQTVPQEAHQIGSTEVNKLKSRTL